MRDDQNWKFLLQFLPSGWEQKAKELGALTRQRKITSAELLLRILLIHLADGCSMRETVIRARESGLADISDVALFKRLKASSEWLQIDIIRFDYVQYENLQKTQHDPEKLP